MSIGSPISNIKRGDTPFYRVIRSILKGLIDPRTPRVPSFLMANRAVMSDILPCCLAMGNPAEVYFRNYGKPTGTPDCAPEPE